MEKSHFVSRGNSRHRLYRSKYWWTFFFPYLEADNSGREKDDDDNEDDDDNDDDNDHEDDDKDKDDREQA